MKKRGQWLKWGLELTLILVVIVAVRFYMQSGIVSGEAPAFGGSLVNGEVINGSDFRGAPVLVHFWASWCGICKLEQQSIQNLSEQYQVLTIAFQSGDRTAVQAYLQEQQLSFPVLVDAEGSLAKRFGVNAVPATFIIDKHGMIRFTEVGYSSEIGLALRLWFTAWYYDGL